MGEINLDKTIFLPDFIPGTELALVLSASAESFRLQ